MILGASFGLTCLIPLERDYRYGFCVVRPSTPAEDICRPVSILQATVRMTTGRTIAGIILVILGLLFLFSAYYEIIGVIFVVVGVVLLWRRNPPRSMPDAAVRA